MSTSPILGVLIPSTNTTAEPEYHRMAPPSVRVQTGRMFVRDTKISDDASYVDLTRQMAAEAEPAARLLATAEPDHVSYGMAATSFMGGASADQTLRERLEDLCGCPVTSAPQAFLAAFAELGIDTIAVLSPFQPAVEAEVAGYFKDAGVDVAVMDSFRPPSTTEIARIGDVRIEAALRGADRPTVQALVQLGTNLPAAGFAPRALAELGKPFLHVNTVMLWHSLRRLHRDDPGVPTIDLPALPTAWASAEDRP
ncbi:MAG: hypothetical protein QM572_19000 [Nocardioides sp.]|uniref:maleate cis-trans isomerase family protein n=1 Tax=Nocardioides sp. TaxID=35761 RepID=UPI0039E61F83